jgi:hypothetical protein
MQCFALANLPRYSLLPLLNSAADAKGLDCEQRLVEALEEPIALEDGTALPKLVQAIQYLATAVSHAEKKPEKVLVAADQLTRSAEPNFFMYFACALRCCSELEAVRAP